MNTKVGIGKRYTFGIADHNFEPVITTNSAVFIAKHKFEIIRAKIFDGERDLKRLAQNNLGLIRNKSRPNFVRLSVVIFQEGL